MRELSAVGAELGIAFLGLGMQPVSTLDEIEWVPKQRYAIMRDYMPRVGTLGHRMMKQTATVQANIDYADERDAMRKLRVGMATAPLVNAIFANSCISEGRLNGQMSYRGYVWTDTDRARCGLLPFAFRDGASFGDYVEWALDVPALLRAPRGEVPHGVDGRCPSAGSSSTGIGGERATLDDWRLHLTTLFPEVRLKGYIELRSADSQTPDRVLAVPALVKGVFYEQDCLEAAFDLVKRWSFADCATLYGEVTPGVDAGPDEGHPGPRAGPGARRHRRGGAPPAGRSRLGGPGRAGLSGAAARGALGRQIARPGAGGAVGGAVARGGGPPGRGHRISDPRRKPALKLRP